MGEDVVIRAEGLGKRYRLGAGAAPERYRTLREAVAQAPKAMARRALSRFGRAAAGPPSEPDFWALKDVGFEVRRGETLGVIGRNGAGKSTLLKILSRITDPTEGRVTIEGRVASLLEVGTGFHPELSGRENIFLNGAILGMRRAEIRKRFDEIVAFADVERFLDTPVKRYSSGMYVRLAFAVAAHLEPEILVVDEVLAVGDAEFQKKCLGRMNAVAESGRTVLFVSHNMGAVSSLCDRALLLEGGRVTAEGDADEVIRQYVERAASVVDEARFAERAGAAITAVRIDRREAIRRNLAVEIEYSSDLAIAKPIGGIVLRSLSGQAVWGTNGIIHPMSGACGHGASGKLVCRSESLPLLPGDYTISVWLSDWNHVLDHQPDCLSFELGVETEAVTRPPAQVTGHLDWRGEWWLK
ncbi:MAG: ABC transporter ATP-binding protein [Caulobacteraceae bacterium]